MNKKYDFLSTHARKLKCASTDFLKTATTIITNR